MDFYMEKINPLVWEYVDKMGVFFQNDDVVRPIRWKPTGDPVADMFSAWDAAWKENTILNVNDTHWVFKSKDGPCFFQQTWQLLPEMKPLYENDFDHSFDGSPLSQYMREYYFIPLFAVMIYLVVVFGGRLIMSFLPAFELKVPLVLWNFSLSLFSFAGVLRCAPHLIATIRNFGLYHSICANVCTTFGAGSSGLFSFLFIISKFPELIDTVFIVLRKKPLIFLHWYHHVTVLLYCWQAYATQTGAGIWFIAMNYTVHSVMYLYYGLAALRMWPKFIPSWIITILQLSQMVVGIFVCLMTYYYQEVLHKPCSIHPTSFKSGVFMYFTYFLLFLQILTMLLTRKKKPVSRDKKRN